MRSSLLVVLLEVVVVVIVAVVVVNLNRWGAGRSSEVERSIMV